MTKLFAHILTLPIFAYRYLVSPLIAPRCKYQPTCSEYAVEALRIHGPLRGLYLAVRRIARCSPWAEHAYDPVPPRRHDHDLHAHGAHGLPKRGA